MVEATVAQPIESRVVGVDNMIYMKSTSGNDGSYTLTVTFAVGTDPDLNNVKVQNRVSLAEAQLPPEVRAQGVNVQKKSSALLQVIAMISPDGRYDQLFLSNYATINIIDSSEARARRRRRVAADAGRLQHADLAQQRPHDEPRPDAERHRQRHQAAERPGGGRPHRRAAGAARISSSSSPSRPRAGCSTVEEFEQHRAARQSGRLVRAGRATWRGSSSARRSSESRGRQDGSPPR